MKSGTNFGDSLEAGFLSGFDPTKRMLFATSDMAADAAKAKLEAAPGMRWTYSDGSYLILSRILRDTVGGDAQSVLNFAHRELFDRLGMEKPLIEFDATGTPVGSSYIFATARDWARLGQLYAQDGVVSGQRILPEGWVDYSSPLHAWQRRLRVRSWFLDQPREQRCRSAARDRRNAVGLLHGSRQLWSVCAGFLPLNV